VTLSIGTLDTVTALGRPDLLAPAVAAALAAADAALPAEAIGVAEIDPSSPTPPPSASATTCR